MNQVIPSQLTSQVLNHQIILDYIGFIRYTLYESDTNVLKFILTKYQIGQNLQYSYDYISLSTGIPYITVRRAIDRLESFGIIQKWNLGGPNFYLLNEFFKQKSVLSSIKRFLIGFMFIGMLSSFRGGEQLLINKDINLLKQQAAAPKMTAALSCWQVMELNLKYNGSRFSIGGSWQYLEKEKVAEGKTNKHLKGDVSMLNFTADQLEQIAHYSQEAIARAAKRLKEVTAKGIAPSDPFKWFLAICKSYTPNEETASPFSKQAQQQPHKNAQPQARPAIGPKSVWKKEERATETDFEWCSKVEPKLHEFVLSGHPGLRLTRPMADAKFARLTPEQQEYLMATVHIDCSCRQIVDDSTVETMSTVEPVTEPTGFDWNSLIPQPIHELEYEEILD